MIDGGEGNDTLILSDTDSIDFSAMDIKNIENIDLTASGAQSVTNLTLSDVIDLVGEDTDKTLKITGDGNDSVDLTGTGTWAALPVSEQIVADSVIYTNTEDSSYKVIITNTIDVDII